MSAVEKSLESLSDEELATLLAEGAPESEACFAELYRRLSSRVLAFIRARTDSSRSDDLLQVVWITAWKKRESFRVQAGAGYLSWLFTIASNQAIDKNRFEKRRPANSLPEHDLVAPTEKNNLIQQEEIRQVENCIGKLTDELAEDLIRGRLAGVPYSQLCEEHQITENRAYKIVHRTTKLLSDCVNSERS